MVTAVPRKASGDFDVTGFPFSSCVTPLGVVHATHLTFATPLLQTPFDVNSNFSGSKRPQVLIVAIRNLDDQDGRPYTMYKFCITIRGDAPMRVATSNAITQLATASASETVFLGPSPVLPPTTPPMR